MYHHRNQQVLLDLYVNRHLTLREVAKSLRVSVNTIMFWMDRYNIKRREPSVAAERYRVSKDILEDLYVKRRLSISKTANILKMKPGAVRFRLTKYSIPIRSISEAMIKYPKNPFSSNKNEKAYMLGLRAGDIYAREHYNHIRVTSTTTHSLFVEMMKQAFEKYSHIGTHLRFNRDHKEWVVYCDLDKSFSFLITKPSRIPQEILNDENAFYSFLAGYIDAEGNWVIAKSNENDLRFMLRIRTYDKDILEQIKSKLEQLGFQSHFYLDRKGGSVTSFGKIKKDFYGVRIYRTNDLLKLAEILLPLSRHNEKVLKMNFILKNWDKKWGEVKETASQLNRQIKSTIIS